MTTTDRPLLGRRGSSVAVRCLRAVAVGGVLMAIVLPVHRLTVHGGSVPVALVPRAVRPLDVPGPPDAWWLAGVLRTVGGGRPFDRRNAARLRSVTGAVLVGGVLAPVLCDLVGFAVLDRLGLVGPDSPFVLTMLHVALLPLLLALVVPAAAEAFRRGAALAGNVAGLV